MDVSFLKWIEHAGFLFNVGGKNVYVDPYKINGEWPKADVIFVTHTHFDHFSEPDIKKIAAAGTKFVAPKETAGKIQGRDVLAVEPGKRYSIDGIGFETAPAYNISKEFHPKANGWVGYVIDADGKRVYQAGDTDHVPEMKALDVDLALLPIGGHYTMDIEEAIAATKSISAKAYAPMHYRALLGKEGAKKAEERFASSVPNAIILEQSQEPRYSL